MARKGKPEVMQSYLVNKYVSIMSCESAPVDVAFTRSQSPLELMRGCGVAAP